MNTLLNMMARDRIELLMQAFSGLCFRESSYFVPVKSRFLILHCFKSSYRYKKYKRSIFWNDQKLKIKWPTSKPIISKKDQLNISFEEFLKEYKGL